MFKDVWRFCYRYIIYFPRTVFFIQLWFVEYRRYAPYSFETSSKDLGWWWVLQVTSHIHTRHHLFLQFCFQWNLFPIFLVVKFWVLLPFFNSLIIILKIWESKVLVEFVHFGDLLISQFLQLNLRYLPRYLG